MPKPISEKTRVARLELKLKLATEIISFIRLSDSDKDYPEPVKKLIDEFRQS